MEFFRQKTNIDFLGIKKWAALLSLILVLASLSCLYVKGLNWGLDFTGGYEFQLEYQTAPDLNQMNQQLENLGLEHFDLVTFGSTKEIMLSISPKSHFKNIKNNNSQLSQANKANQANQASQSEQSVQDQYKTMVAQAFPSAKILSVNFVGPQVGAELAQRGMLAMLIAVIAIMIYIALRFEMRFAFSAAVALAHDPILILGIFSFLQLKFDLNALAAVLAVIGYSLNDTVVVYDRFRENFRKLRHAPVIEVVNRAINDTLSRTIMTSGLTLLVVLVLFFFGGPSIHGFSLALIIGVIVGTYSSIYVAGALAVMLGLDREALLPAAQKVDDLP